MQPFESTYVSTFVFAMGYIACRKKINIESSWAASLAQSKGDQTIGDLVLNWTGRKFIFEFKRNLAAVASEFRKPHKKRLLETLETAGQEANRKSANRAHFLAYGVQGEEDGLRFVRYTNIREHGQPLEVGARTDVFIEKVVFNPKGGLGDEAFRAYLNLLAECAKPHTATAGGRSVVADMEVLVVSYDDTTGTMRFASVDLMMGRSLQLDRSHAVDLTVALPRPRGPDRDDDERGR